MKYLKNTALTLFLNLAFSSAAMAHSHYILPSHTQLSGQAPQHITLTASISNDFFHPDKPLGNSAGGKVDDFLVEMFKGIRVKVVEPDGSINHSLKFQAFSRQSIADLELNKSGTYRLIMEQAASPLVTFKLADGTPGKVFSNSAKIPAGATDVVRRSFASRTETYISLNGNTNRALQPLGSGIELVGATHPNDLFVGEVVEFQLLLNGKPLLTPAQLELTRGGTRHRNNRNVKRIRSDAAGKFEVTFAEAGNYLLEVDYSQKSKPGSGLDMEHNSLYITLEVFPQ